MTTPKGFFAHDMYAPVPASEIPADVLAGRWDQPWFYQGQIVRYAYCAEGRAESGPGARYRRRYDGSDGSMSYERLKAAYEGIDLDASAKAIGRAGHERRGRGITR